MNWSAPLDISSQKGLGEKADDRNLPVTTAEETITLERTEKTTLELDQVWRGTSLESYCREGSAVSFLPDFDMKNVSRNKGLRERADVRNLPITAAEKTILELDSPQI